MNTSSTAIDPAADAAALLRRLGFATLMLALPTATLFLRRGAVLFVPIGIALIIIAAALDGLHRKLGDSARAAATSPAGLAGGLLLLWCGLSLLWTPFFAPALERFGGILATVAIAGAGYLALPDRMRSANLYLLPVGAGIAAVIAILLDLFGQRGALGGGDGQNLARGLVVLAVFLWPALAWLRSRQRHLQALLLAVGVAVAAALGPEPLPLIALAAGAAIYALTAYRPALGVRVTALGTSGLLALAPFVPLAASWLATLLLGEKNGLAQSLRAWTRVILAKPLRMITGHGFETAFRGRGSLLSTNAPNSLLFDLWYDLGIIGALAGAAALYFSAIRAGREDPPLVPAIMALYASAFTLACLGVGTAQMWWFTALVAAVLVFVATERGQFRTTRPKASFHPANDR